MKGSSYIAASAVWLLVGGLLMAGPIHAQRSGEAPPAKRAGADLNEQLGTTIPLDLTFRDEEGKQVELAQFFDSERPVVLNLAYHSCPMLCGIMLEGVTQVFKEMSWTPGDQFEVLTVSFNHREGPELAREKKEQYLEALGKPEAAEGWHFLTGDEEAIEALTDAVGFQFRWIEEEQQYAHPAALIFLSGEGKVTRYLHGLRPPDLTPGDTRKALVEASDGEVGNVVDKAISYCFQYDPDSNSYVASAFNIMRLGGLLTMVILGVTLFVFWRRERSRLDEGATFLGSSG